jgi:hypothetical protein
MASIREPGASGIQIVNLDAHGLLATPTTPEVTLQVGADIAEPRAELRDKSLHVQIGTVNVGETFEFKVKLTNQGPLDMKSVRLRANGTQFADVALSTGSFGSSALAGFFDLDAHQIHTTGVFRGKCTKSTGGAKDIVTAQVDVWDASLDHILIDHTGAGAAEGKLNKNISPT